MVCQYSFLLFLAGEVLILVLILDPRFLVRDLSILEFWRRRIPNFPND